ncbi:MAG: prepilin-type N-terminal cleavage/methylation domain-containing protein [Campylobacter sp.]|uniref:prepilin-type N-terminal cleavage/methylation domain-containing protein n=1 Tax=Campylobacter sp. TaxID=205 RepID=UPI0029712CBD|nr:prepilin-type N-terminal cleavage/methylation domain-containing protein [Campylobacter sp.]MDD7599779.1 prepilin-type N-terminal cleavage/methylation domain-containing protein [Campylobacteraceae bacterium]MDD7742550.1 prepilin-type N-terminal cleavage/methylation domain-containing protein [Campylobacteraceae bacterium]MDY3672082.1 prepilin-type N-terminal cleavage/methylation domain-containing protein [Campylobacter sp.]MDY4121800.1 prepilin-type N-terminal cleavage/methylation domain-conta
MKKAFTIIELVFVIVALGILAMVALPRLVSSKEDAEITRVKAEIAAIRSAIQTYRGANLLAQKGSKYPEKLDKKTIEEITNGIKLSERYWSVSEDGKQLSVTIADRPATFNYDSKTGRLTCKESDALCLELEN